MREITVEIPEIPLGHYLAICKSGGVNPVDNDVHVLFDDRTENYQTRVIQGEEALVLHYCGSYLAAWILQEVAENPTFVSICAHLHPILLRDAVNADDDEIIQAWSTRFGDFSIVERTREGEGLYIQVSGPSLESTDDSYVTGPRRLPMGLFGESQEERNA